MGVGPEQRSEPAEDETATPPRPGRTGESAVEPRMPELRLQRHVGDGAVAEHPVTQMPAAAVSGKACAVPAATVSGKACAVFAATVSAAVSGKSCAVFAATVSAAVSGKSCAVSATTVSAAMSDKACPVPAATMFGTMPAATMFATVPAATMFATMPAATMPAATVSAATMPAATVSAATVSAATVPAATALRVCFECEKRHDEEQHRGQASAGRQHQPHGAVGLGAPHRCGRLSLGILQRTKSF
jgi:hypothetical protein